MEKTYRKSMFKVSSKGRYAEENKTKGTTRVTIGYLPDYYTLIQPYIDYCITVWGYAPDRYINKIQVLQNRATRVICDNFDWNMSASALVKSLVGLALKKDGIILWVC